MAHRAIGAGSSSLYSVNKPYKTDGPTKLVNLFRSQKASSAGGPGSRAG